MLQNHPIGIEGVSVQRKSFQRWGGLLRVAASSNLFVNQLRQSPERGQVSLVDVDDMTNDLQAPESDTGQTLDLQQCLLRLPSEQREVLLLVSLEDLSYAEVAKVMGVPIGTVMSRLSRARVRLQALLESPARPSQENTANHATPTRIATLHRLK
jgi:RNA polymerase sigma-70 factor (ECF subfamily)